MANNQLKEELILSTQHFDQKIDDVIKKVNKLQQQGNKVGNGFNKSMSGMIQKATGFNGSMGSLVGVVGKFSGALGIAVSAGDVFNRMLDQSQNLGDAVARVQNQAGEAVNFFASSLASADFGGFLNGLRNIISLAGKAADEMDRATSIGTRFGWTNQAQMAKYNKAMAEARNPENSKEDRKKYLNEAKQISEQIAKTETLKSQQDIKAAFATIRTELAKVKYNGKRVDVNKLSDQQIRQLFDPRYFTLYEGTHNQMQKALDGQILTNTKYGAHGAHLAKADADKYSKSNLMLAAYAANEINDNSDSSLGKALQMIGAADQLLASQAERSAQIGKLGQRIENFKKNSGGGVGGKKETPAEKVKHQLEDAINKANLLADELQDVQKNTLPSIDERLNNISAYDKLNAQRYQSLVKQGKGKFSFGDTGGTKTYDEAGLEVYFTLNEDSVQDIYTKYDKMVNRIQEAMRDNELGILSAEEVNATIDNINKELEKLGLKPLQLHVETDAEKALKETTSAIDALGSSFQGLGQALEVPALDVAGVMASAIAKIIEGYAFATSEAGKALGPIGWLGFGAIGLAQLVSIISTVKSLGAYANGGIVGGSSYAGDRLYARVNSGEMILNSQQQSHLFNMINNGGGGVASTGEVQFVIKGSDLYGTLKNYNSKMGKVR